MRRYPICWSIALAALAIFTSAMRADIPYFNGFETPSSVNDFYGPSGQPGGNIARVASGGGTLGYIAASGNYYAEIQNTENFSGGLGYAGYTGFGSPVTTPTQGFAVSVDIYVDTARWQPTGHAGSDFVISTQDMTTTTAYDDEFMNIFLTVTTPGTINVSSIASSNFATITKSGWYQFVISFVSGSTGNVENDVSVLDQQGDVVGTAHYAPPVGSMTPLSALGGNGYMIFGPWQNGFAGDVLAIDNLQTIALPEPAVFGMLLTGLALIRRNPRR
jgi:hypothetical protein